MALSYASYNGDGTTRSFAVPFSYINKADVTVLVDGVAVSFSWLSGSLVQTAVAPANGTTVQVRRFSKKDARLVDFQDSSTLTESDLDLSATQALYLAQEADDRVSESLRINRATHQYDASGVRITNLADPAALQDAATAHWVDQVTLNNQNPDSVLDAKNGRIRNLADPTSAQDAATRHWVDQVALNTDNSDGLFDAKNTRIKNVATPTTTGDAVNVAFLTAATLNNQNPESTYDAHDVRIKNLGFPAAATDAAPVNWVNAVTLNTQNPDTVFDAKNIRIKNLPDPVLDLDAANKQYVIAQTATALATITGAAAAAAASAGAASTSASNASTAATNAGVASAAAIAAQNAAEAAAAVLNATIHMFDTRTQAMASTLNVGVQSMVVRGYTTLGDMPEATFIRVASQPTHAAKLRTQDRLLPNGTTDATNGGWWVMVLSKPGFVLTPNHFGAPNNGVGYDDTALNDMAAVLALGICKSFLFKGAFRVYADTAAVTAHPYLFAVGNVDGLQCQFIDATFTVNVDQLSTISGSRWVANLLYFGTCRNFRGIGRPKFVGNHTIGVIKDILSAWGVIGMFFENDCSGITLDGAEGQGILCPLYMANDVHTLRNSNRKPIIVNGGTGYTNGDAITVVGGAGSTPITYSAAVSGGAIVGLALSSYGDFPDGTLPSLGANTGYALSGGTGTGARAVIYMERAESETRHTVGGNVGFVKARDCFYAYVQRNSGSYVESCVDAEFCFRSTFTYGGITGLRNRTTIRHMAHTAVILGQAQVLGLKDAFVHVRVPPNYWANAAGNDVLIRPSFNNAWPCSTSIHVDVDVDYGEGVAGTEAANLMGIGKYNGGVTDTVARGHELRLKVTGRIRGKSPNASEDAAGTHISTAGFNWAGDQFGGWEIGPLNIEGGGNIIIDPKAFPSTGGGINFDVVNPDGYVTFNNSLTGTEYLDGTKSKCKIGVSARSRWLNRNSNYINPVTIGVIETSSDITLLNSWHDWVVRPTNHGTAGTMVRTLPSNPEKGLRYRIYHTGTLSGTVRVTPSASFAFAGKDLGKYVDIGPGGGIVVECTNASASGDVVNVWTIVSAYGTLTFQP